MTSVSLALWGAAQAGSGGRALASPSPAPADVVRTPEPDLVTPGTIGFLVTFGVAVALVLLVRDMVRRNRGLVVRAERRDAELREAELRDAELRQAGLRQADVHGGQVAGDGGRGDVTRPAPPATPGERPGPPRQGPAAPNG